MVKKEELHVLIQSLTKSEKRYFKLFCAREASGGNYLGLFDAIHKQQQYDERVIKEQFKEKEFVQQMHVTKNYLRKLILKSLRNFHAGVSKDAELKDVLRNVEILYNKELHVHCETELKRADAIARKYELIPGTVEVEGWKRKLEQAMRPHNYTAFKEALVEQEKAIEVLRNSNAYWQLAVDISTNLFEGKGKLIKNKEMLDSAEHALTLEAKVLYYNTAYLRHIQKGNGDKAQKELRKLIKLIEKHPQRIKEEPGLYVSSINNLVTYFVFNKKYKDALKLIQKAKRVYEGWRITSENRTLLKQILRTFNIELEIYRDTKAFDEKSEFIDSTEAFIKANVHKMPKEYLLSFWFQLASIHFMRQDLSQSLQWINQLLNARFKGIRTNLQVQAHFLNLMVHFEQQNLMVLRYYVDSTRRYMKKVKQAQPFEDVLLKFFVKVGRLPVLEYKAAFAELAQQLFPDDAEPLIPADMLGYIDYREWVDRKLKRNKTSAPGAV